MIAGWIEGEDPAFTIVPGLARNIIYIIRLLTGVSMLAGSVEWLMASLALKIESNAAALQHPGVKAA